MKGVRTENRKITEVWLGECEFGYSWGGSLAAANPFEDRDDALRAARWCRGPWFNLPDPETLQVLEADYQPPTPARLTLIEESQP